VDVQPSVREVDRAVRLVPGERGREEESRDVEGLCARLDRQERLVGDLAGLVSRLMERLDARDAAGPSQRKQEAGRAGAASGRATASGRKGGGGGGSRQGSRWRRHRTVLVGSAACAARGAKDGNRLSEGVLRVVSRSEPVASVARLRPAREGVVDSGGEFEELAAMSADNDLDEDADGQGDRMKRFYLSPDDDLVRAPSIGAKTAARLRPVGLVLVRDLLSCDPADIALRVSTRYITAGRISDWKAQARLVCTIPWLRGTHAQLLVGAGYDTLAKLSRADASAVCAAILRFSATREGQSILRSGPPPEIDRIACWIENTALAEPARAA
jgi:predicted flap endonuclease-1-like 5' DNA nuclease